MQQTNIINIIWYYLFVLCNQLDDSKICFYLKYIKIAFFHNFNRRFLKILMWWRNLKNEIVININEIMGNNQFFLFETKLSFVENFARKLSCKLFDL